MAVVDAVRATVRILGVRQVLRNLLQRRHRSAPIITAIADDA